MGDLALREDRALNPLTGELLDLGADTFDLAQAIDYVREAHRALAAFEARISDELLARLDQQAAWTLRSGEYEITAPSPTAGTVDYPLDALEAALRSLIEAGTIGDTAAEKACVRTLALELAIPFSADHHVMAKAVKDASTITVAGVEVRVLRCEARGKASAAGIVALRKVPGVTEGLDGASVTSAPKTRKVTVKRREAP